MWLWVLVSVLIFVLCWFIVAFSSSKNRAKTHYFSSSLSCCVVGAGPSGLVVLKELLEGGFTNISVFEKEKTFGGAFASAYDSQQFTSSTLISQFSDFCVEGEKFWTKEEYLTYLARYIEKHKLAGYIHYGCEVQRIKRGSGQVKIVEMRDGKSLEFDRVVICSGVNNVPIMPSILPEGIEIIHSSQVKRVSEQDEKKKKERRVLVIGAGESATDLALLYGSAGDIVCVASRLQGYLIPRYASDGTVGDVNTSLALHGASLAFREQLSLRLASKMQRSSDPIIKVVGKLNAGKALARTFGVKTSALAEAVALYECRIEQSRVKCFKGKDACFENGTVFEDVDLVVCATGFKTTFSSFVDDSLDPSTFDKGGNGLFYTTFHPEFSDVALVGFIRPTYGSLPVIAELQARWLVKVWSGETKLPSTSEMKKQIARRKEDRAWIFGKEVSEKKPYFEEFVPICLKLSTLAHCDVNMLYYFFTDIRLWWKLLLGPFSSARWRIQENRSVILNHRVGNLSWIAFKSTWFERFLQYVTNTQDKDVYL